MKGLMLTRAPLRIAALLLLSHVSAAVGAAPSGTLPAPPLWRDAVSRAGRSAELLPGTVHADVTVSDAKGNIRTTQQTWSRLSIGTDDAVVTTVVRALKNGRDNTKEAQAQLDRNPERGRFDTSLLPIMPSNQERVDVASTGRSRTIAGDQCAGFSFHMRRKRGPSIVGTVWLDERTGAPVLIVFTFDPLPTGATVIENTLHFTAAADGTWHLASLDTYAEGRLLFFERVFRLHMVFSDYFRYSPPGTAASGASQ